MSPSSQTRRKRIDAQRNQEKILVAARRAFTEDDARTVSMAQIARRAGVGMATLYRNYPGRRQLLEAVFTDEVDDICAQAAAPCIGTAGDALFRWLQLFFDFARNRNDVAVALISETGLESPVFHDDRRKICAAAEPLLEAAQTANECRSAISIGQTLDALVYIAHIQRDVEYVQPIVDTFFHGLRMTPQQTQP